MTRASDTARLLGAGATILDGTTISTADNTAQLTLTSTDADGSRGPQLALTRTSASPADNDLCGVLKINGKNDAAEDFELGEIVFTSTDVSNGSEDSKITINGIVAGASAGRLNLTPSEAVFNEDSIDMDFRVESNGNTHALFVQGGSNFVGIGNSSPNDFGSVAADLVIGTTSGEHGMTIASGTGNGGRIQFADNTSSPFRGAIEYDHSNDKFIFYTAGSSRMTITSSGQLVFPIADTTSDGANVNVRTSDGLFRRSTSSRRFKNTINDATHGLTELLQLRSVTFKGNNDGDKIFGGLIAEEVHDAGLTEFVQYNDDDEPDALAYGNMVSLCIKAIQELKAENTALTNRITALENA